MKLLKIFLILIVIGLIALGGFFAYVKCRMNVSGTHTQTVRVLIPAQKNPVRILSEEGLIPFPFVFKVTLYLTGKAKLLKSGEYDFPAGASMQDVLDILVSGKTVRRSITVPEGLSSFQIIELLQHTEGLSGELSFDDIPPNGTLLPETYAFTYGDTRVSLLNRMEKAMTALIDPLFQDQTLFRTKTEALSMACLIEKETSLDAERPLVSAVFHNRLTQRMKLQSDTTVTFALTQGRYFLTRPLTFADLKIDSPFNTYLVYGLPPEPICNPGRASVIAAFLPADVDYLYFVASPDGGHLFAKTIAEHNQNVAVWRTWIKKERARVRAKKSLP